MKLSAVALLVGLLWTIPAVASPGDPRLLQGKLEWPTTLSGGESFIVLRGDDSQLYYADVTAAKRYAQAPLNTGSRIALLGLEGVKPHEIIVVALGSGDTAALSLAIAQVVPTTSAAAGSQASPTPASAPPSTSGPVAAPEPPARREEARSSPGADGRWVTVRGSVHGIAGQNLFVKNDDGRIVVIDITKLEPTIAQQLRIGAPVAIVAVPVGNKFQATGLFESEPTKPAR